jgi:hypothetical protein
MTVYAAFYMLASSKPCVDKLAVIVLVKMSLKTLTGGHFELDMSLQILVPEVVQQKFTHFQAHAR